MDNATAKAALITKDVDAAFGNNDLIALRDQGTAKIIFKSEGDPRFLKHSTFIGTEAFIDKYPEITARVVKNVVLAAKWAADNDANPAPVFQLWTKSGTPFSNYKEDYQGHSQSLKVRSSPLIDEYVVSQYQGKIKDAKRYGLIKETFDFKSAIDDRFLKQALRELNLESYWKPVDIAGKPKS